jgi:undecaprenyl-diphosphatase
VLLPWLAGWSPPADRTTFGAALHAGSCLGICWALRHELRALDRRTLLLVAASSVPAAVAGALAADRVEQRLGRPPQLAALLAGAGALMWWVDARAEGRSRATAPTGPHVALAALAQVAALVPGVSRSGATLTALRAAGVERAAAERFSLLMSLPVTAGAAGLTLSRARAVPAGALPGAVAAALAGAVAVRRLRPGRSLAAPALYRLGLAAVVSRRLHREGAP